MEVGASVVGIVWQTTLELAMEVTIEVVMVMVVGWGSESWGHAVCWRA
jgi:hypothetical protein